MKKKLFGILLSFGLVLTMIPATVFAETQITEIDATITLNCRTGEVTITSPTSANYEVEVAELWAYNGSTKKYQFSPSEHKWSQYDGVANPELLPLDNVDNCDWTIQLIAKSGYEFSEGLSAITINGNEYTKGVDYSDYSYTKFSRVNKTHLKFKIKQDEIKTKSSSLIAETEDDSDKEVKVDYIYNATKSETAEKSFYVTIDYKLPASLDAKETATYEWDHEEGKYSLVTSGNGTYKFSNGGAFEIKITNQSNVGIDYTVSYVPNTTDSVFVSKIKENTLQNYTGNLSTVAQGQNTGIENITITDETLATTGNTDFQIATCTGTLEVTGTAGTPNASGTDVLGTFKVNIAEHVNQ